MSLELRDMEGVDAPYLEGGPWINSEAIDLADQRGLPVLLWFWTMSCHTCMHQTPFIRDWWNRYHDKGILVIGVHTPRFEFEKDWEHVERFCRENKIVWPVVMDNERRIRDAYRVPDWPWLSLIDAYGIVRFDHAGAADYALTDEQIINLLAEVNTDMEASAEIVEEHDHDAGDRTCYTFGPDVYCGYEHERLGNPDGFRRNIVWEYRDPGVYEVNRFCLEGPWEATREYVRLAEGCERFDYYIAAAYTGNEANAVIGNTRGGTFKVYATIDGGPVPSEMAGRDLEIDSGYSYVMVDRPASYQIIRDNDAGTHLLRLTSDSDEFAVYQLTFGGCLER